MNPDITTGQAAPELEPLTAEISAVTVPTLREQIEHHLSLARKAAVKHSDQDLQIMHLAIAAGIGLACTTLDDASDASEQIAIANSHDSLLRISRP